MNIIKIDKNNQVNGAGLRVVLWVAGCEHHCPGCHNPETWDYKCGHKLTREDCGEIFDQLSMEEISGITLTGGDPFAPNNREEIKNLCEEIKLLYPDKTIWAYSGYLYKDLLDTGLLNNIDVLIDGRYVAALNPGRGQLKWRGSSNQRIIDVKASLAQNTICDYKSEFE